MDVRKTTVAIILSALAFESSDDSDQNYHKSPPKRRRVWVKDWVRRRDQEDFCAKLYRELRDEEPALFNNFLRMNLERFHHILSLVSPLIVKKDTHLRKRIPHLDRLLLTLRFLATGESFRSLQYLLRIPWCTIATIVPEVLDAIYKVLVGDYLQVCNLKNRHIDYICSLAFNISIKFFLDTQDPRGLGIDRTRF